MVRDDNQKIVGWYLYYVKPGAVAEVVQIGGEQKLTKDILDHLFYDAWKHGAIALHGVVDIRRMADFSDTTRTIAIERVDLVGSWRYMSRLVSSGGQR